MVQRATEALNRTLPDRAVDPLSTARRVVGQAVSRLDGPSKVTGGATFTADIDQPGLAYASMVPSRVASGRIRHIDVTRAANAPGVIDVITHHNAPAMDTPVLMTLTAKGCAFTDVAPLQDDVVRWNGQAVAVVVAESQECADSAARLVDVVYDAAPARTSFRGLLSEAVFPADVLGEPSEVSRGDVEDTLSQAAFVVDEVYTTPPHHHMAIELHATMAQWSPGDKLHVWDSTQALGRTRHSIAHAVGVPEENVTVTCRAVGGGFGNKTVWDHQLLCVAAARVTGRPVRLVLRRQDVFRMTGGRAPTWQRVALGAAPDGHLQALVHDSVTGIVHENSPEQVSVPARHLYASDTYRIGQKKVVLDVVPNASMRAPGDSVGSFALESAIDELAGHLGIDPIELRSRNEPAVDPTEGTRFSKRHLMEAYRRGAERFGWPDRNRVPGARRDGRWLVGHGTASAFYPYIRMPGGKARIRITADGHAVVTAAANDMGMGTETVQVQHAAERLGLPLDRVSFEFGDSTLPDSPIAAGSAQTASLVITVAQAAEELKKVLLRRAPRHSALHGLKPADVVFRDGGLYRVSDPAQGVSFETLVGEVRHVDAVGSSPMLPLEFMKYSMHGYGAHFCEVRVDATTGETRVSRWVACIDAGRIINPKTAASQIRGAVIMGIGSALMEEGLVDSRAGRTVTASAADYHMPVHADVCDIDVSFLDIPDPLTPMGVHGVGEIGIVGVAAAIANAVHNATGVRVRDLPITLDKIIDGGAAR
ncbi:xanthine dehydrogenase family protein molybdopterin-binding subunit [Actinoplanes sp. M2I2]|uniref:xanthine dehydrogenase family protein molybdopterin-binding subunit n=1 Tax=Actinoplanes sp. M2I2 TaxID=1734444 RepID=UPI002021E105|nr:xanthine dehydrogenase family protein molybdopterin-binding subunit [Actinoplanes sp. M2I2]